LILIASCFGTLYLDNETAKYLYILE
jgi:hypothetical protein